VKDFLARHASKVTGVLSGFDRIVFRGYLRSISYAKGFETFLVCQGVLLKEFSRYVRETSVRLKAASLASAEEQQRPPKYINSGSVSKEGEARRILAKDPVDDGLICVLTCVEPCLTYEIHKSNERKRLELRPAVRKCTHVYHYFLDPKYGFMSARIQTWFPFNIQICLNGREWLCRQMDRAGLSYQQRDNCFTRIEHVDHAQKLLNSQLETSWPTMLNEFAQKLNPAHTSIFGDNPQEYYWCLHQSEWATDVMFRDSRSLAAIYPSLSLHAITKLSSPNVMRFLGQKVHHAFKGEIISDFKDRPEGIRVKHQVRGNSVKMYDKQGSLLRIETTISQPRDLKVFRPKEGDEKGKLSWRPLRKGVADIQRRAKLSHDCNDRYLQCLATVDDVTPVRELTKDLCRPASIGGRRVRALRPWSELDADMLRAVNRGEFVATGFRNRDITAIRHPSESTPSPTIKRKRSAATTRRLRLLRAHRVIRKIPKTHRYQVSDRGRLMITAILAARDASVDKLTHAAAA
jgi:hypothetical protein